jgi:signal transduction histidine kinase
MTLPNSEPARVSGWRIALGLAPAVLFWAVLVGWLAYVLYARTQWWQDADEANVREWLDEARVFRKSLPELVREYLAERDLVKSGVASDVDPENKAEEIREQLQALADPTRAYQGQLPLFPEIYRLEVHFADPSLSPIVWDSPVPKPRQQSQTKVSDFTHYMLGRNDQRAWLHCEYRLHAFNKIQRDEEERAKIAWIVGGLVLFASMAALVWVYYFLRRERVRELSSLRIQREKEQAERLLLENELHREELNRKVLEQSLELSEQHHRASEAERSALELKSQLYASIGIMAGSYAHNIKNLLVRPNDLLARCIEADSLSRPQAEMLHEVRHTLGTVTERLQQILRTVRRDPTRSDVTLLDLNELVRDSYRTWEEVTREKWKLHLHVETAPGPLMVRGDLSHLQQAVENLLFNARDGTFEMRNHLREQARSDPGLDPAARKHALLDAAGWKGEVVLRTAIEGDHVVLEVRDNGIGMTEEVRRHCTETHFSTKRDNAIYEGNSTGMGLGLSFVTAILEHHRATLEIESQRFQGAVFRVGFPLSTPAPATITESELPG